MATLQILKEIMTAVNQQRTEGQDTPGSQGEIKPCDYFDLICGTSTGGLIALMLGRLEFVRVLCRGSARCLANYGVLQTVDDAIQKYKQLANDIFKKEKTFSWNAKYDHKPLERKLKEVVSGSASPLKLDENALLVDNDRPCKSFVVTTNLTSHSAKPVLLRAYETEFEVEPINQKPVKIWEAGRATSAAPTFFGPYKMEDGLEYTDGGTIANNPTELGYQEAGRLWQRRKIDLIVSIGTGPERALTLSSATEEFISPFWFRVLKRVLPRTYFFRLQLAMYSVTAMTNTGRTHERVQENINTFQGITSASAAATPLPRIYFRLNVEDKSALVQLDACDKMDHLMELAKDYINRRNQERDQIATILLKTEVGDQDGLTLPPARSAVADDSSKHSFLFETFLTLVEKGDADTVKTLLERGADVNFTDFIGRTPLMEAAQSGHENVVKLLLEKGANVNSKDKFGQSSLSLAAEKGHQGVVRLLLEKGADIDSKDVNKRTPLLLAAVRGYPDVVRMLLDGGADFDSPDDTGQTPLMQAVEEGHKKVVNMLLDGGANVDSADKKGWTPLRFAVDRKRQDFVVTLLERGAKVNSDGAYGQNLLHVAVETYNEPLVKLFLDRGVDVNSKNSEGNTPLTEVAGGEAERGNESMVKLLLDRGADVNVKDSGVDTPLHSAALFGNEDVVRLLLERNADVDSKGLQDDTALSAAAMGGFEGIVKMLLEGGAKVDSRDAHGNTPLSEAVRYEWNEDIVRMLLERGADVDAKNSKGETPLSIAKSKENWNILKLLESYQSK